MEITVEEFEKLNKDERIVFDIRPETDRAYGFIPDSVSVSEDELRANPPTDKDKAVIVYCAKGILSVDIAEQFCEQGLRAYSLQGGYSEYLRIQMQKQVDDDFCKKVEQSITGKFKKDIFGKFYKAIKEYRLIKDGDRIAVCISGGKDSMLMAKLFQEYKRHSDLNFDVKYLVMDPGYAKANREIIEENARRLNVPITVFETDIFESVYNVDKSPCYLCARMRRGVSLQLRKATRLQQNRARTSLRRRDRNHTYGDVARRTDTNDDAKTSQHQLRGNGTYPPVVSHTRRRHKGMAGLQRTALYTMRLQVYRHLHVLQQRAESLEKTRNKTAYSRTQKV